MADANDQPSPDASSSGDPDGGSTEDDAGSMDPDGGGPSALIAMSDEFDDPATLSNWRLLHVEESRPAQHSTLAIDTVDSGRLTLVPVHSGWYADGTGPFLFKEITGDFVVQIHVNAGNVENHDIAPTREYNAAGILVRDPDSVSGDQDWLAFNLGYQSNQNGVGTEGKTTVDSVSTLYLNPGARSGRLSLCRLGNTYHMLRWLDDESSWTEVHTFTRADLPDRVQVGMMANGWTPPPDLYATFSWIRFAPAQSMSDCTSELQPAGS
jgi:hypothetical protein